jgi:pyruvate dehydrogenase E1 component
MREMLVEQQDVFYYITMMNENYAQPSLPVGTEGDVVRGCYKFNSYTSPSFELQDDKTRQKVTLMGSGAILLEVIKAAQSLALQGITATVYSVTSWSELARDGQRHLQSDTTDSATPLSVPFLTEMLQGSQGPIIAATDYVCAVPESVRAFIPLGRAYRTLGTDGFGRSDTRAALRAFFGVDAASIERAALRMLKPLNQG